MLFSVDKSKHFSINHFFIAFFILFDDYHVSTLKSTWVNLLMSDIITLWSDVYIYLDNWNVTLLCSQI